MKDAFHRVAVKASQGVGSPVAFILAVAFILIWAASGPLFDYSELWHLLLNSPTTAGTFAMLFLLQHTQNRDTKALHAKLDELIRASEARNSFIEIEQAPEEKLQALKNSERLP